jgi:hypothetical protein
MTAHLLSIVVIFFNVAASYLFSFIIPGGPGGGGFSPSEFGGSVNPIPTSAGGQVMLATLLLGPQI